MTLKIPDPGNFICPNDTGEEWNIQINSMTIGMLKNKITYNKSMSKKQWAIKNGKIISYLVYPTAYLWQDW